MEHTNERWRQFGVTRSSNPNQTMKGEPSDTSLKRYWWISDHGRVKVTKNYNDSVMWPKLSLTGGQRTQYLAISKNNFVEKYVHRLVARFFIGMPPETGEKWTVNHIDGNKLNNHYTNLEWVTYKENIRHYWDARRANELTDNSEYVSLAEEIRHTYPRQERDAEIIRLYQEGWTQAAIQEIMSLTKYVVARVVGEWRKANNIKTRNTRK